MDPITKIGVANSFEPSSFLLKWAFITSSTLNIFDLPPCLYYHNKEHHAFFVFIQSWKLERMEAKDNISISVMPEGEKVLGGQ